MMLKTVLFSLALVAGGCATRYETRIETIRFAGGETMSAPDVAILGKPFGAVQQLVGTFGDEQVQLNVQLESDGTNLTVAGISPMGNRVFLVRYSPGKIYLEEPPLHDLPFTPQHMVRDIFLVFGHRQDLLALLPGWKIVDEGTTRTLSSPRGFVMTIHKEQPDPWVGKIRVERSDKLYTLEVVTVEQTDESAVGD